MGKICNAVYKGNKSGQFFLRILPKASSNQRYLRVHKKLINQYIKAKELTLTSQLLCTTRIIGDGWCFKRIITFCCDRIESDTCFAPQLFRQTDRCNQEIDALSVRETVQNKQFPKLQDHRNDDKPPFCRFLTRKSAPFLMRARRNPQWNVLMTCAKILITQMQRKGL